MNGRIAKKIRRKATINVRNAHIEFVKAVMRLPFWERLRFCKSILLKRQLK